MYGQQDQYGQRGTYEEQQKQQQQQNNLLNVPVKTVIGTDEIREMVRILNDKPFNENLTLVSFDELSNQELLDLLNKILSELDSSFKDIKSKPQDMIIYEVVSFIKVLNYPVPQNPPQDSNWQNGLFNSEKRIIYPVMYYLLSRFSELKKRAYLAKYLVPYQLMEGIPLDEEIKKLMDQYKDLQAEFQVNHKELEAAEKDSMNPEELKKEIIQLQSEREQLLSKINQFKGKNTNNPQFQALLDVTNSLRREQEEEARIQDKLRQQRAHLEWTDQQLLASQQRLFDAKKSVAPENTPEQMLMSLRAEVKKNRELQNERLAIEINEKSKKLQNLEKLLSDPPVTQNELQQWENQLINLRRNVNIMEDKLGKQANPDSDKLSIYKKQAQLVSKKKEKIIEEQKRADNEMTQLDKEVKEKQQKLEKERGPGFSNDEFKNFVEQLKVKHTKYKKLNKDLADLKAEVALLSRTEDILKDKKQEYQVLLEKAEKDKGVTGAYQASQRIQQLSEQQQLTNEEKGKTLEEISKLVQEIKKILDQKKATLQPQIKELKDQREQFKNIESEHKEKKANYDKVMVGAETEISQLESEVKKLKEEVEKEDKRQRELKEDTSRIDEKARRLQEEAHYQKGTKKLSSEHQTYVSQFEADAAQLEEEVQKLRQQREVIKDNYQLHQRQIKMFGDLKVLLQAKLQTAKSGGQGNSNVSYRNQSGGNVNRLVIDN
ncbi:hypothetical protein PPERSA_01746 [Pseudocohnilembus persalinus]|uniref:IFT81 calponin homology domain-containing protein n=1 Tax=Pseudocohnilembus persalinus TaxID=266149 RepID=A0A0V0R1P3_PSEPJ|nr:hypothetical protein PPERSA_01746 [Pseudocohnilembus persalinus]|eukprot:KRX08285.1 hypothetical protein PPERSA_01746 [Pseudocohnilembus persalinus]